MNMAIELALVFAVVFAVNLLPAFGPPTWSVIVVLELNTDLPLPGLVIVGALAAASGRFTLAHSFRMFGSRISGRMRRNLDAVRIAYERKRRNALIGLGLFALSPLPSAQLFGAVGLAGVRLLPFTLAFFAGRLVSYTIYGGSAQLVEHYSLQETFMDTLTSPWGIALQILLLVMLAVLPQIDWAKIFKVNPDENQE